MHQINEFGSVSAISNMNLVGCVVAKKCASRNHDKVFSFSPSMQDLILLICTWDTHFSRVTISLYSLRGMYARIAEFQAPLCSYIHPVKSCISISINNQVEMLT